MPYSMIRRVKPLTRVLDLGNNRNLACCVKGGEIDVKLVVFYRVPPQLPDWDSPLPTDAEPRVVRENGLVMDTFSVPAITGHMGDPLVHGRSIELAAKYARDRTCRRPARYPEDVVGVGNLLDVLLDRA